MQNKEIVNLVLFKIKNIKHTILKSVLISNEAKTDKGLKLHDCSMVVDYF